MKHLLTCTAVALVMGLTPAIATENAADQDMSTSAAGSDTSTGAKEQSSAPPSSEAADKAAEKQSMDDVTGSDDSTGAKEQSSAPEGSSAAEPGKANPTIGSDDSAESDTKTN
jgi:hypothetical protein